MRCRCAEIYVKLYPTPCTSSSSSSQKVGAGDVVHGGTGSDDDDSRREYRAFEQWRDGIYYVVGSIQILATFTNAGTSSVYSDTAGITTKITPAKLRLHPLLLQYPELLRLFHQFKYTCHSSGKS